MGGRVSSPPSFFAGQCLPVSPVWANSSGAGTGRTAPPRQIPLSPAPPRGTVMNVFFPPSLLAARRARAPAAALSPRRRPVMIGRTRREFFADVGRGMLVAGVGSGVAADLGLA